MAILLGSAQKSGPVKVCSQLNATLDFDGTSVGQGLTAVLDSLHAPDCIYFPIRHHSPACAWHLASLIRKVRPSAILVEGPASFTPLIPTILDADTRPPIAVYTHFIDVDRRLSKTEDGELDLGPARFAAYYPFCDYSPELIALRCGREVGARLEFIDLENLSYLSQKIRRLDHGIPAFQQAITLHART